MSETYIAEIVPLGKCVETTLTNIHNPMDSLLRIGGLDIILINRMNESQMKNSLITNMAVESLPGPGEEVSPRDLPKLAVGSVDIFFSQLVPGAALE